jgi:4-amino-4-deoxy-L-arabinose transferase-like glycosyltransferase
MSAPAPRLLLAAAFLLFATWSLVVPINEAPDEPAHWQYARYLHDHWRLPHYAPGFEEANSPPLAYALFAPLALEDSGPEMVIGYGLDGTHFNLVYPRLFVNTGEAYRHYWAQRLARLLAAAISVGTVLFVWRAGLAAGGPQAGLLAALIVTLLPMFAFRAGHVSNDALLACCAAASTWGFVRLVREPFAWRVAWWTSAAVGLAYLSKISAIALVPPFALALLAADPPAPWRTRAWRLSALALAGVLVAPWSIRNVVLYGDPFASEAMRHAVAHIITDRSLFSVYFLGDFPRGLIKSFIGVFGWVNVLMPPLAYRLYLAFFALGLGGALLALWRRRLDWRLAAVLAVSMIAALAIVIRINLQFTQPQGRYLLPGLPAFAVLIALGLRALPSALLRLTSPAAVGGALLAGNLYALVAIVWPTYYPAPIRTLDSGVRVMVPSFLSDLAVLDADNHWVVTGPTPQWMTRIETPAGPFAAFEVELTATMTPVTQHACVYFASIDRGMHLNAPVCADWAADGRPHAVRLVLRGQPGWAGEISHLRLNPFQAYTGVRGVEVWTRHPRLVP